MKGLLTAIDESVVVLGERLRAIALARELDSCNAFGATAGVEVKGNLFQRPDS